MEEPKVNKRLPCADFPEGHSIPIELHSIGVIHTSGLDVFDGTPLLDIKPYIQDLDVKTDANYGWLDDIKDRDHLMLHIKGIPHKY